MADVEQPTDDAQQPDSRNIRIFMRIRPVNRPGDGLSIDADKGRVEFFTPKGAGQG
jgi:hypothetical protein